jgi:hypothetical protein
MLALVALSFGHVFMVFAVDPYALRAITTGGYDESKSPEARNARPFVNLRASHAETPPPEPEPPVPPQPEPAPPSGDPPPPKPPVKEPPNRS